MKCVRDKETDKVIRVDDQTAKTIVEANPDVLVYVPKSVWKARGRPN